MQLAELVRHCEAICSTDQDRADNPAGSRRRFSTLLIVICGAKDFPACRPFLSCGSQCGEGTAKLAGAFGHSICVALQSSGPRVALATNARMRTSSSAVHRLALGRNILVPAEHGPDREEGRSDPNNNGGLFLR
jgi:hypothetical protein